MRQRARFLRYLPREPSDSAFSHLERDCGSHFSTSRIRVLSLIAAAGTLGFGQVIITNALARDFCDDLHQFVDRDHPILPSWSFRDDRSASPGDAFAQSSYSNTILSCSPSPRRLIITSLAKHLTANCLRRFFTSAFIIPSGPKFYGIAGAVSRPSLRFSDGRRAHVSFHHNHLLLGG